MKFTTLTARFPGTCKRCNRPINVGDIIRYGGKGQTYHLAAICTSDAVQQQPVPQPEPLKMTPALAQDIRSLFNSLLDRPVQLIDPLGELPPSDRPVPAAEPQPEPVPVTGFAAIPAVHTAISPALAVRQRTATIDADLF